MHDQKNGTEISIRRTGGWLAVASGCPADSIWADKSVQNGGERLCPSDGSRCGPGVVAQIALDSFHGGTLVPSIARSHGYELCEFETPPPKPGSIQWDIDQRPPKNARNVTGSVCQSPAQLAEMFPGPPAASLVNGPKIVAAPTPPPPASSGIVLQVFFSPPRSFYRGSDCPKICPPCSR